MILLGLNPSGFLHFGNYLSLIKPSINLNKKKIFLADLHSLSKKIILKNILKNKIFIISVFLSFFQNIYFYQSYNKNILNFFWLILCIYNKNKTKFFHSYYKKIFLSLGKICYPLLMCSDIILNKNKYIFIGYDQIQHIEIYKKILKKINLFLSIKLFKKCNFIINNKILYSFNKKKMSKSNKNDLSIFSSYIEIYLFLKKFKKTKNKKKSILNFSLNIINNIKIIELFFNNNEFIFLKKVSKIIFFKFLPFKNKFLFYLKNIENIIFNINKYNKYNNLIIINNNKNFFNYINL